MVSTTIRYPGCQGGFTISQLYYRYTAFVTFVFPGIHIHIDRIECRKPCLINKYSVHWCLQWLCDRIDIIHYKYLIRISCVNKVLLVRKLEVLPVVYVRGGICALNQVITS